VREIASSDKKLLVFPSYGHVLIGTSYIQPDVKSAVTGWLNSHVSPGEVSVSGKLTARSRLQP
jgi:hypothetical protein